MPNQLILVGILAIFVGVVLLAVGVVLSAIKEKQSNTGGGFIFFLGPFPIFWGASSKGVFYALLAFSLILIFAMLFFRRWF